MGVSIQETYTLPSRGKVYTPEINPSITLRSMTTLEEKKRLGNINNQFKLLADIIDDCIINKPKDFSSYNLLLGDFQYLLFKLRTVTYGNMYRLSLRCPRCGESFEKDIDLDQLNELTYQEGMEDQLLIELPKSKDKIRISPMTPRKADEIEARSKDILTKSKDYVGSPSYILTLMAVIDTVNGETLAEHKKQKYVESMLAMDANYLKQKADKIKLGVDTHCVSDCPICKTTFPFLIPFTPEFLGPTVD